MSKVNQYIMVLLDEDAKIIKLDCTLEGTSLDTQSYIGKDWFDHFIDTKDKEKVFEVFQDIVNNKIGKWKTNKNDIVIDGKHKLIDFNNEVIMKDGKKLLYSYGFEHKE